MRDFACSFARLPARSRIITALLGHSFTLQNFSSGHRHKPGTVFQFTCLHASDVPFSELGRLQKNGNPLLIPNYMTKVVVSNESITLQILGNVIRTKSFITLI